MKKVSYKGKWLRLAINDKHDINGKSFPSLANIIIYGKSHSSTRKWVVKPRVFRSQFNTDTFTKFGLMSCDSVQFDQFNLSTNQRLPSSWSDQDRSVYVVEGCLEVTVDEEQKLNLQRHDVLNIGPETIVSFSGLEGNASFLWILSDPQKRVYFDSR